MADLSQWQMIVTLFREHNGVLTTAHFKTPHLWSQYRRALCQLRSHGYAYKSSPISKGLWKYELIHEPSVAPPITVFDTDGQGVLLPMETHEILQAH